MINFYKFLKIWFGWLDLKRAPGEDEQRAALKRLRGADKGEALLAKLLADRAYQRRMYLKVPPR
jgi:hypothetical protein